MPFDAKILSSLTRLFQPTAYLRCTPLTHKATPLGMGFGDTRFASTDNRFKLLYIAKDLPTAIAEAIVRDRFEGVQPREMLVDDFADWGVCEVDAKAPLRLADLLPAGGLKLGILSGTPRAK